MKLFDLTPKAVVFHVVKYMQQARHPNYYMYTTGRFAWHNSRNHLCYNTYRTVLAEGRHAVQIIGETMLEAAIYIYIQFGTVHM